MTNDQFQFDWLTTGRKAKNPPNPDYPDGLNIDTGERPACKADLPYPAPCCGTWLVHCKQCETNIAITAAGRIDDPRSIMIPCRKGIRGSARGSA